MLYLSQCISFNIIQWANTSSIADLTSLNLKHICKCTLILNEIHSYIIQYILALPFIKIIDYPFHLFRFWTFF